MGRTEIRGEQVRDDALTGADLNDGLGVYDETNSYEIDDIVFWNARNYRCTSPVTGTTSGDLSNAPDVAVSNWVSESSSGITETQHKGLNQLVHNVVENNYYELIRNAGNKVTGEVWWTDSGKTIKIREVIYTYTGNLVTQVVTRQYNDIGTLVETYTENITRTGNKVTSIDGIYS